MREEITLGVADHHEGYDLYAPSPYTVHDPAPTGVTGESGTLPTSKPSHATGTSHGLRLLEGANPYPTHPADFESVIESWTGKMRVLGMAVMTAMTDGLSLEGKERDDLLKTMEDSFWIMRLLGKCGHWYTPCLAMVDSQDTRRWLPMRRGSVAALTRIMAA